MNKYLTCFLALSLALLIAGCANADQSAAQQVVLNSEQIAENSLNGKGDLNGVYQYFATPLESGNIDTQMDQHIGYIAVALDHKDGKIGLSKFEINSISLCPGVDEARVLYQVDITITRNGSTQTETLTQGLLLTKTLTRGWRIMGSDGAETTTGDVSFLGNLGGQ